LTAAAAITRLCPNADSEIGDRSIFNRNARNAGTVSRYGNCDAKIHRPRLAGSGQSVTLEIQDHWCRQVSEDADSCPGSTVDQIRCHNISAGSGNGGKGKKEIGILVDLAACVVASCVLAACAVSALIIRPSAAVWKSVVIRIMGIFTVPPNSRVNWQLSGKCVSTHTQYAVRHF
jgi:hypothetical protein